ncbi:MAG: ATP-binding protein [Dethiobacteria bacterium]|jgi:signal transduction histidine kinase
MRHQANRHRNVSERRSITFLLSKLVEAFDLDNFLTNTASLLKSFLTGIDAVIVYLYDDSQKQLIPVSISGFPREHVWHHEIEGEHLSVIAQVFKTGKLFVQAGKGTAKALTGCITGDTDCCAKKSLVCVPMDLDDGTRIGCLLFITTVYDKLSPRSLGLFRRIAKILSSFVFKAETLRLSQEKKYSSLVCTLSHELRTPLTCIKGYATTLLDNNGEWSREEGREFLKIIDAESDTMKELIDGLMESSMIESGLFSVKKEPVLLARIVEKAVDDARLRTTKHKFVVSIPKNFPVIEADPARTRQVLDNLLENAIKYSPEGGLIVIQCRIDSREVTVSVADEGVGIAPEHLNRLFEKFYRVKSDLAGTGLGLPVASEIVEKQGGRIWASSTPGKGSTFCFTLPFAGTSSGINLAKGSNRGKGRCGV